MSTRLALVPNFHTVASQSTGNVFVLHKHGEQARTPLMKYARALAIELGLNPDSQVVQGPMKTPERIVEKAEQRYAGDRTQIHDICRDTLYVHSVTDIERIRSLFVPGRISHPFHQGRERHGITPLEIEDNFAEPKKHGWIGINLKLKIDLGKGRHHIAELQITHEGLKAANEYSHKNIYSEIRARVNTAKKRKLSFTQRFMPIPDTPLDREIISLVCTKDSPDILKKLTPEDKDFIKELLAQNRGLYNLRSWELGLHVLRKDKDKERDILLATHMAAASGPHIRLVAGTDVDKSHGPSSLRRNRPPENAVI